MVENNMSDHNVVHEPLPRRWGLALLVALLIGGTVVSMLAIKWRETLKVQRVIVEGVSTIPAKEVVAMMKVSPQASMFSLNLAEIGDRISRHPFILSVSVSRQLPNSLRVDIVEREPVATINCGQLCYVDREGMLLACSRSSKKFDLPLISGVGGVQNARPGATMLSKGLFEAIDVCQTAEALDTSVYHMISEVNMNNGGDIILYSSEGGVPIVLGRGDVARKLVLLQNFWINNVGTADAVNVRYIDLRYEDQVVVRWARQPGRRVNKISS